jgi:hypothetical protein
MGLVLDRRAESFAPGNGLLLSEHFQMAYVTNDMDRAFDLFSRQLGIRDFVRLGGPTPEGGQVRAEFAWMGSVMYEIIEASGPGSEIFNGRMPGGDGFKLFHHHLGFLIHDQAEWDGVLANAAANGWVVPHKGVNPLVEVCFVDVPGLPHYLEYLYATPMGLDFFNSVPRN